MRLSREKIVRLSHVAVDAIAGLENVEFVEDRNTVRLEIVRVLQDLLKREEEVEEAARQKISTQKRSIPPGSAEWETLYRKYYFEELRRLGIA
jgi:hypothetical protein